MWLCFWRIGRPSCASDDEVFHQSRLRVIHVTSNCYPRYSILAFAMPLGAASSRTRGREEARDRGCRIWAEQADAYPLSVVALGKWS